MSRKLSGGRCNPIVLWTVGISTSVALIVGCGSNGDSGDDTAVGTGGYSPISTGGKGNLGGSGVRPTGGRPNFGTGRTGGTPGVGVGGRAGTGGAASTCPQGSQGCPCYVSDLCATPSSFQCVSGVCCSIADNNCNRPTGTGGAAGTGGRSGTGGASATGGKTGATGGSSGTSTGGKTGATGGASTTGGSGVVAGGSSIAGSSSTGGTTAVTTGGAGTAPTGGAPAATGGTRAATGGAPAATGGAPAATGGTRAATGGAPAATGGAPAATGGAPAATGGAGGGTSVASCPLQVPANPTAFSCSGSGEGSLCSRDSVVPLVGTATYDCTCTSSVWKCTSKGASACSISVVTSTAPVSCVSGTDTSCALTFVMAGVAPVTLGCTCGTNNTWSCN